MEGLPELPRLSDDSLPVKGMFGRWLGTQGRSALDMENPMGTWTGMSPTVGAPLSGALYGAGAGALFSLAQKFRGRPNWKKNLAVGAAGGLGVGLISALMQAHNKQAHTGDTAAIIAAITRDASLPAAVRSQLVSRVNSADGQELELLKQFLATAGGASVGYAIARFFGMGLPGAVFSATLGGIAANNFLTPKVRYV